MDSEKRQRVLLAATAIMSVGAGSYWFFGRNTGGERPIALVDGEAMRKPRIATETPSPPRRPSSAPSSEVGVTEGRRKPPQEPEINGRKPRPPKSGTKKPVLLQAG